MAYKRNPYRILVGKQKGERPLGRPTRRWKGSMKMDLREKVWGGTDWVHMAQYRVQKRAVVNTVMNYVVP
jgi:hypothetical protein